MSLITIASINSVSRGYDYFERKVVVSFHKINETEIQGKVKGNNSNYYDVFIDIKHPRKSKCNCPHADGRRVICKHMIALYFTVFPNEAKQYYDDMITYELEEEYYSQLEDRIVKHLKKMKKEELQTLIIEILNDGPEWQYDRFIRDFLE